MVSNNKKLKLGLSVFLLFLILFFFCPLKAVQAVEVCDPCSAEGAQSEGFTCSSGRWQGCPPDAIICNPLKACSFQDLIDKLISIVTIIAIALVPLMFTWAGFKFVTAQGEPEKIKQAKNIMLYTVIGLAIVLFSRAIISLVKGVLGSP